MTNNIFEQGCLIHLQTSIWTGKVKLSPSQYHVDADPDLVKATKYLVDHNCLKPVERIRNDARNFIYGKTLPFPIPGVSFIPKDLITSVDEKLKEFQIQFDAEVQAFCDNYNIFIADAKQRLNGLFDESQYPQHIEKHFNLDWRFFVMETGQSHLLSPEIYEREKTKFLETIQNFEETAIMTLRESFSSLISHIVDRLSGDKIFRNSLILNIKEFINDFKALNISDDSVLESLIEKCKSVISGVNPDTLRENESLKSEIHSQMKNIQSSLDSMMKTKPVRKMLFIPNL